MIIHIKPANRCDRGIKYERDYVHHTIFDNIIILFMHNKLIKKLSYQIES